MLTEKRSHAARQPLHPGVAEDDLSEDAPHGLIASSNSGWRTRGEYETHPSAHALRASA
jgi:hypothetical protein